MLGFLLTISLGWLRWPLRICEDSLVQTVCWNHDYGNYIDFGCFSVWSCYQNLIFKWPLLTSSKIYKDSWTVHCMLIIDHDYYWFLIITAFTQWDIYFDAVLFFYTDTSDGDVHSWLAHQYLSICGFILKDSLIKNKLVKTIFLKTYNAY